IIVIEYEYDEEGELEKVKYYTWTGGNFTTGERGRYIYRVDTYSDGERTGITYYNDPAPGGWEPELTGTVVEDEYGRFFLKVDNGDGTYTYYLLVGLDSDIEFVEGVSKYDNNDDEKDYGGISKHLNELNLEELVGEEITLRGYILSEEASQGIYIENQKAKVFAVAPNEGDDTPHDTSGNSSSHHTIPGIPADNNIQLDYNCAVNVIFSMLEKLNIDVTPSQIAQDLTQIDQQLPVVGNFTSFYAIREVLEKYGINYEIRKNVSLEELSQISAPAVLHLTINGEGHFVILKEVRTIQENTNQTITPSQLSTLTIIYDEEGNPVKAVDEEGNEYRIEFTNEGTLVFVPLSQTTSLEIVVIDNGEEKTYTEEEFSQIFSGYVLCSDNTEVGEEVNDEEAKNVKGASFLVDLDITQLTFIYDEEGRIIQAQDDKGNIYTVEFTAEGIKFIPYQGEFTLRVNRRTYRVTYREGRMIKAIDDYRQIEYFPVRKGEVYELRRVWQKYPLSGGKFDEENFISLYFDGTSTQYMRIENGELVSEILFAGKVTYEEVKDFDLTQPSYVSQLSPIYIYEVNREFGIENGEGLDTGIQPDYYDPIYTYEFLITPHWDGNDGKTHIIFCASRGDKYYVFKKLPDGRLAFGMEDNDDDDLKWVWDGSFLKKGETVHIILTHNDTGEARLYVNGELKSGTRIQRSGYRYDDVVYNTIRIGDDPQSGYHNNNKDFEGFTTQQSGSNGGDFTLHFVRIYDRMIGNGEAKRLYEESKSPLSKVIRGWVKIGSGDNYEVFEYNGNETTRDNLGNIYRGYTIYRRFNNGKVVTYKKFFGHLSLAEARSVDIRNLDGVDTIEWIYLGGDRGGRITEIGFWYRDAKGNIVRIPFTRGYDIRGGRGQIKLPENIPLQEILKGKNAGFYYIKEGRTIVYSNPSLNSDGVNYFRIIRKKDGLICDCEDWVERHGGDLDYNDLLFKVRFKT
ncbi:MAG TPA: hypothetical protein ENF41_00490, partial [Candidatus Bathyarchaeota archaeon]|nr:hypothetical protein [Candidatus Bathyarchaeota archaeon]